VKDFLRPGRGRAVTETFSVTIRLTSLRVEAASSDFYRPEGDDSLRIESEQRPLRYRQPNAEHLFPFLRRDQGHPRRKKPPKLCVRQLLGVLNRVACCFSFYACCFLASELQSPS
jgi:hypothetical protein